MYKRKYSFAGVIASILALILLVICVLAFIPETRTKIADFIANNFSPAYAEIKDDNAKKDSLLDAQKIQLNEYTANINLLKSNRTVLLDSLSEIDNKINSTTDKVELNNLNIKKTAILEKIDELNNQIKEYQNRIDELEKQPKCSINSVNYVITDTLVFTNSNDTFGAYFTDIFTILEQNSNFENFVIEPAKIQRTTDFYLEDFDYFISHDDYLYVLNSNFKNDYLEDNEKDFLSDDKINLTQLTVKLIDSNGKEFSLNDKMRFLADEYQLKSKTVCELYTDEELQTLYPNFTEWRKNHSSLKFIKSLSCSFIFEDFDSTAEIPTPVESKWTLNDTLTYTADIDEFLVFSNNGTYYKEFTVTNSFVQFGTEAVYNLFTNEYLSEDFKNITFYGDIPTELLNWLQANATKVTD